MSQDVAHQRFQEIQQWLLRLNDQDNAGERLHSLNHMRNVLFVLTVDAEQRRDNPMGYAAQARVWARVSLPPMPGCN